MGGRGLFGKRIAKCYQSEKSRAGWQSAAQGERLHGKPYIYKNRSSTLGQRACGKTGTTFLKNTLPCQSPKIFMPFNLCMSQVVLRRNRTNYIYTSLDNIACVCMCVYVHVGNWLIQLWRLRSPSV